MVCANSKTDAISSKSTRLCLFFFHIFFSLGFAQLDSDKYCFYCLVLREKDSKLRTIIRALSTGEAPTAILIKIKNKILLSERSSASGEREGGDSGSGDARRLA